MEFPLFNGLQKPNRSAHYLARNGIFLAVDCHLCDFRHFLHNTLDFGRIYFLATYVDDLRLTPEDPEKIAVYFDFVPGLEPAVVRKWAWRVQVAKHRRFCLDLKNFVDNTGLKSFTTELNPERIGRA